VDLHVAQAHLPAAIAREASASLGAALAIAAHVGGSAGAAFARVAKESFVTGVNFADVVGMAVAVAGIVVAAVFLPARARPVPGEGRLDGPVDGPVDGKAASRSTAGPGVGTDATEDSVLAPVPGSPASPGPDRPEDGR
ncbi:MAG: hypothetical protein M0Z93_05515, partial [Actinomycetota bacterium]|nr:hypothetical protein [Actinomycetota bacterium]